MNLSMGNKNVVVGLVVIMVYMAMSFFIERTAALHGFHSKAAAAVVDTKGTPDLLDDQVTDVRRGPAYRTGGIYFTNYYPASYVAVPNAARDAGYNMRLYGWIFALFGVVVGIIVGLQAQASRALRSWASRLAIVGVVFYPLRDAVSFWSRWLNPGGGPSGLGPILYPITWIAGAAMFLSLLLSLIVFVQGTRHAPASKGF
jgi:hypothetical protein